MKLVPPALRLMYAHILDPMTWVGFALFPWILSTN
jgi:hypothetical protein